MTDTLQTIIACILQLCQTCIVHFDRVAFLRLYDHTEWAHWPFVACTRRGTWRRTWRACTLVVGFVVCDDRHRWLLRSASHEILGDGKIQVSRATWLRVTRGNRLGSATSDRHSRTIQIIQASADLVKVRELAGRI